MATITCTPTEAGVGDAVVVTGEGFTPAATITVSIPQLGIASEIVADAGGFFGTDDIADHAVATLTSTGVNVADGDTVTVGSVTYRFKDTMAQANDVQRGGTAAESLANLKATVNLTGTEGTEYFAGTAVNPDAVALTLTPTTLLFAAKTGGTGGNALDSLEGSTQLSFGGATFSGGTAATGISALILDFESEGTFTINASDGTNSASTSVRIWSS